MDWKPLPDVPSESRSICAREPLGRQLFVIQHHDPQISDTEQMDLEEEQVMLWNPWKPWRHKALSNAHLCLHWLRHLATSKLWREEVCRGPPPCLSTIEPASLPWWPRTEMYKVSRSAMPSFRQLSQKYFINKNKLNLTDSLEGNF